MSKKQNIDCVDTKKGKMSKNIEVSTISPTLECIDKIYSSQLEMSICNVIAKLNKIKILKDSLIRHHIPLSITKKLIRETSLIFSRGKLNPERYSISFKNIFSIAVIV